MAQWWAVLSTEGIVERLLAHSDYLKWNYTRLPSSETTWRLLWSFIVLLLLYRFTKFRVSTVKYILCGGEEDYDTVQTGRWTPTFGTNIFFPLWRFGP